MSWFLQNRSHHQRGLHVLPACRRLEEVDDNTSPSRTPSIRGDQLRLFATGLGIVTVIFMSVFLGIKYNIRMPSRGNLGIFVWGFLACLFVAYTILRFVLGRTRADDLTSTVLEKFTRIWRRVSVRKRVTVDNSDFAH